MRWAKLPSTSCSKSGSQSSPQITLDDVPTSAAEDRFKFLYYLPIAAHRAVEALEVAIDDPDEVVELFARGRG